MAGGTLPFIATFALCLGVAEANRDAPHEATGGTAPKPDELQANPGPGTLTPETPPRESDWPFDFRLSLAGAYTHVLNDSGICEPFCTYGYAEFHPNDGLLGGGLDFFAGAYVFDGILPELRLGTHFLAASAWLIPYTDLEYTDRGEANIEVVIPVMVGLRWVPPVDWGFRPTLDTHFGATILTLQNLANAYPAVDVGLGIEHTPGAFQLGVYARYWVVFGGRRMLTGQIHYDVIRYDNEGGVGAPLSASDIRDSLINHVLTVGVYASFDTLDASTSHLGEAEANTTDPGEPGQMALNADFGVALKSWNDFGSSPPEDLAGLRLSIGYEFGTGLVPEVGLDLKVGMDDGSEVAPIGIITGARFVLPAEWAVLPFFSVHGGFYPDDAAMFFRLGVDVGAGLELRLVPGFGLGAGVWYSAQGDGDLDFTRRDGVFFGLTTSLRPGLVGDPVGRLRLTAQGGATLVLTGTPTTQFCDFEAGGPGSKGLGFDLIVGWDVTTSVTPEIRIGHHPLITAKPILDYDCFDDPDVGSTAANPLMVGVRLVPVSLGMVEPVLRAQGGVTRVGTSIDDAGFAWWPSGSLSIGAEVELGPVRLGLNGAYWVVLGGRGMLAEGFAHDSSNASDDNEGWGHMLTVSISVSLGGSTGDSGQLHPRAF